MNRRQLITGLISLVAAPAIVRVGSLMPIRGELLPSSGLDFFIERGFGATRLFEGWTIFLTGDFSQWGTALTPEFVAAAQEAALNPPEREGCYLRFGD